MHKTPPLRVSRPVSACSRCRAAKIRCDGKLPACTACERTGRASECSSGNDQFARGKERSYVASLENRIERLERQLHYRQTAGRPAISIARRPSVFPLAEPYISREVEASDVDELVSDFGHLAVNATSNAYHGFDREMSLARLLLSTATVNELPRSPEHPLPPHSVAVDLLHACVANFFTLCPVMSFASILGALERVYYHSGRLSSPQDIWNVRLCLAMGLSARSKSKGDPQHDSAIRHVSMAIDRVGEIVIAPSSLDRLRGLLLLVLFSTSSPTYLDSWYLMGMAARFMAEMGLHATAGISEDASASQVEERRILFLLVYGLDRYVSMSRLQPFSFSDDSADLSLPPILTPHDVLANKELARSVPILGDNDDYARLFVQIHQDQSAWYQALFYTDHEALHRPFTIRLHAIHANHAWLSRIPQSATGPLRCRFTVQILYGSVLLALPTSSSVAAASAYGKAIALEYVCAYADAVEGIAGKAEPLGTTKNDDYLRTSLVSKRLLQLIRVPSGPVYTPAAVTARELECDMALPKLDWVLGDNVIHRVIESLRKLDSALAWLNRRYDHAATYRDWKMESESALQLLYSHYSLSASSC